MAQNSQECVVESEWMAYHHHRHRLLRQLEWDLLKIFQGHDKTQ